ncbi:hypothetical protein AB1L05_05405 [Cytobacillus horneckiae]|nr:hypothetical protein [Cytobacillus horneckiae]MEC1155290.1 hypothetical protein [Cytobacillus horneckiae]MED2936657.1 hypothetical protein [Cytobacillus horneckiae]
MIEFLLQNPLLIVVLIGIITSVFGNKSKQEQQKQQQKQKQQQQRQQETRQQQTMSAEVEREERKPIADVNEDQLKKYAKEVSTHYEAEISDRKQEVEEKIAALRKQRKQAEKKANAFLSSTEKGASSSLSGNVKQPSMTVGSQKLVDAVIWSEILGPPRSMKPHRARQRK